MKIHEYQGKALLRNYGIPVPDGEVAATPEEAGAIAEKLAAPVAVKAQVHVGGRGKAGGIQLAQTPDEARDAASRILGMNLKGLVVEKVLVERAGTFQGETYLGIARDRASKADVIILSASGGVDIEEVAETSPEAIARIRIDPLLGLQDYQVKWALYGAGIDHPLMAEAGRILRALYRCYVECDAELAEINPLATLPDGSLLAADAKVNLDENALFRHPELSEWQEASEEDPLEAEAHLKGLNYVHLGGEIGVIGCGAGLVMATLDEVKRAGGNPADFLDVGGGARAEVVASALETVTRDTQVKGLLLNMFGGITRCDEVARGILDAVARLDLQHPMVVRLTGTNEEEGKELLRGTSIHLAETMEEGAALAVELCRGR
ncbi:MAG TPA: ADP-forming succinate--CoA ligase subunit beta [Armatimonadota bacterium]|jgi:succinyl-CoA synthetase beta subunit